MDHPVIALQHVEPLGEAAFRRLEYREVMQVLDLMVRVQLPQEKSQAWRKPNAEVLGVRCPLAKRSRRLFERRADFAEHRVAPQPELCHRAEIGMAAPYLARIAVDQQAQLRRPTRTAVEEKIGGRGFCKLGHRVRR